MNTLATPEQQTQVNSEPPFQRAEVCDVLYATLSQCRGKAELYQTALRLIGQHFDSPYSAIHIGTRSGVIDDSYQPGTTCDAAWKKVCEGLLLKSRYDRVAHARMLQATGIDQQFVGMAVPLAEGSEGIVGSLALVTQCEDIELAEARLRELRALTSMVGVLAISSGSKPDLQTSPTQGISGVAKAATYESLHEFAFAIANNLKGKLGCDQVCFGLVRRHRVKMLCMSGLDNLYPRSPGARLIGHAMNECLDAGEIICYQKDANWEEVSVSTGHRLHRQLHDESGNSAIASVPLMFDDRCVAVLTIRNPAGRPFDAGQLKKVSELVTPLAPGLLLLEKANKRILGHISDAIRKASTAFFARGAWGRKAAAVFLLCFAAWLVLGTRTYFLAAPCELAPVEIRHVASPFQGTIEAVFAKPGESVSAGTLLLRLDTKELEVEREKLLTERRMALLERTHAAKDRDLPASAQADARVQIAESQLTVIEQKIAQAEICAPTNGTILLGDLSPRVGEVIPLGEPLLQFAPPTGWTVKIYVPEHASTHLQVGQAGRFTVNARPEENNECTLERIHTSSVVHEGQNVFTVEASLQGEPPNWVRAGMQGLVRIDAGKHPVWWVWLHRPLDTIRLQIWKL